MGSLGRDKGTGKFAKQPATHFRSRRKSVFYTSLVLIVVVVLPIVVYGIRTRMNILFNWRKGFVQVTDPNEGNTRPSKYDAGPTVLIKEQQMISKELYDEVVKKNKKIESTVKKLEGTVKDLQRQLVQDHDSVWYWCSVIAGELSQKLSIDTALPCEDDHTKEVYLCVQRFLNTLGYYDQAIDGDQGRTKAAVKGFQEAMGLIADGKLGRQTWNAMICEVGKKLIGEVSPE